MARRPKAKDLRVILLAIADGSSLRQACIKAGVNLWATSITLKEEVWRTQYACAREIRADFYADKAMGLALAAAMGTQVDGRKITPEGARVGLDAIKWATARMCPATAPATKIEHQIEDLTPDERNRRIEALAATLGFTKRDRGGEASGISPALRPGERAYRERERLQMPS